MPKSARTNRNLLIGLCGGAAGLLMLSCCLCGGGVLLSNRIGGENRLVGTWKGDHTWPFLEGYGIELRLKSNGRYEWTSTISGEPVSTTETGDWELKRVEGDRYILEAVADVQPDDPFGWTIDFEEKGLVVLTQSNGDSWRLTRQ